MKRRDLGKALLGLFAVRDTVPRLPENAGRYRVMVEQSRVFWKAFKDSVDAHLSRKNVLTDLYRGKP